MATNGAATHGIVGGKDATSKWSTAKPTNLGKANERDAEAQAEFEAKAEEKKKLDRDYRRTEDRTGRGPGGGDAGAELRGHEEPADLQPGRNGRAAQARRHPSARQCDAAATAEPSSHSAIRSITSGKALEPVFERYPDLMLDGELYNHSLHADFNELSSIIRKKTCKPDELKKAQRLIEYHIYDCPSHEGGFADRHRRLLDLFSEFDFSLEPIVLVPTLFPQNLTELDEAYGQWLADGYEGQMVRLNLPYDFGIRSQSLWKRKTHITEEFEVTRVIEGNGNWAGCAKAIEFKMPSGALTEQGELPKCGLRGTEAFARELLLRDPPPKIVTVRHLGLTPGGVPRGPVAIDFDRKD
jgi:DNA ligase-1